METFNFFFSTPSTPSTPLTTKKMSSSSEKQHLLPSPPSIPSPPTSNSSLLLPTHITTPQQLQKQVQKMRFLIKFLFIFTALLLSSVLVLSLFAFGPLKPAIPFAISYYSPFDNQVHFLSVCHALVGSSQLCPSGYPSYSFHLRPIANSQNNSFSLYVDGHKIGGNLYLYPSLDTGAQVYLVPTGRNTYYMGLTIPGQDWGGFLYESNTTISLFNWLPYEAPNVKAEFSIIPYIPNILF